MASSTNDRDKVDEIKSRLDIVNVIGQEIDLHSIGNCEYVGSVPPVGKSGSSLKVNQKIQAWNDMKNNKRGDVLDWIGDRNGLDTRGKDFPEVLRIAAGMVGVELADMTEEERNAVKEKADIHNLFTEAAEIYHKNLTPELYYFIEKMWGINQETVDKLKIGYATLGRNLRDLDETTLKKSGMVYVNNGRMGGEVFQGRITFPYWKNGKVVYIIGRKTDETPLRKDGKEPPKYQKLLVHKGEHEYVSPSVQNSYFYGEDSLRGAEYCIITEGVADCIAMSQAGFPCISPVTVHFRDEDHPKLTSLTKRLKKVYICNDNEANKAGLKGALSTAEALEREGIGVRLIILPKPEGFDKIDVAEYMKEHTPEDFKGLMNSSKALCEYVLEQQVISTSSTSTDRLRDFKVFSINDLSFMPDDEWEVFVKNEVVDKFRLKKKDINKVFAAVKKERQEKNKTEAGEKNTQKTMEDNKQAETEDRLSKYPAHIREQAYKILKDGEPLEFILGVWQKRHVGDTNIGENCLCSVVTRNILNSERGLHIKPSGDSGKGKSDAIECVLELLPKDIYITGSMSAKALFYDDNLKPGTIIYSDDASFSDDVKATIKQSTSKFQKPTLHRTVVNGESQTYPIPERVTFWFSAVEGMDDEQLANRFLHAEVDNSHEQDLRVHQHQKDKECWYESDTVEPDVLVCRCIFDIIFEEFYRVKISFVDAITWNNPENRRNFEKYKDVIRAVTVYNCYQREYFEGFLMATVEDYERALKIYKGTSVNNATNLTDTELKYLRYIVAQQGKTVTVKMLVNKFKVTDAAVRKMLNGKNGNGGLLAKVKQLIVLDESTTIKDNNITKSSREKRYQYTGEFTGLDLYESIASLDYEAVETVTLQFKAQLSENKARVTKGNLEGNLSEVTLKNNCSNHNNIIDNNNLTINTDNESGYNFSDVSWRSTVQTEGYQEKNVFSQDTSQTEEIGYAEDKISQKITETTITYEGSGRLPLVTIGDKNGNVTPENGSYPSNDIDYDIETEALDIHNQGNPNFNLVPLLMSALRTLAWSDQYNGIVEDLPSFVKEFNENDPEYERIFGYDRILFYAGKLKKGRW